MREYNRDPKLDSGVRKDVREKVTFKAKLEGSVGAR